MRFVEKVARVFINVMQLELEMSAETSSGERCIKRLNSWETVVDFGGRLGVA